MIEQSLIISMTETIYSLLALLPYEIKRYHIFPQLDVISRILIRVALGILDIPDNIPIKAQQDLCKYSLEFYIRFQHYIDENKRFEYSIYHRNLEIAKYINNIVPQIEFDKKQRDLLPGANLVFLCSKEFDSDRHANLAAERGYLEILEWLQEEKFPICGTIWSKAAESGNLDIINFCLTAKYQHGQVVSEHIWTVFSYHAARSGHINILEFIKNKGKHMMMAYSGAACGGQIECLNWLKQQGVSMDKHNYKKDLGFLVIIEAKDETASLEGLKWIHKNVNEYFSKEKWISVMYEAESVGRLQKFLKIREWIEKTILFKQ